MYACCVDREYLLEDILGNFELGGDPVSHGESDCLRLFFSFKNQDQWNGNSSRSAHSSEMLVTLMKTKTKTKTMQIRRLNLVIYNEVVW